MKETYEKLKMEVIEFEAEDVITASGECTTPTEDAYIAGCNYIA